MRLSMEVNDQEVELALNGDQIQIQGNFDEDDPDSGLSVSVTKFELGRDSAKIINNYILDGLNGGTGIWEGLPFKLKLIEGADTLVLTDGFLDLAGGDTIFLCDQIEASVLDRGGNAWLQDNENAYSYEFLASGDAGVLPDAAISPADYVYVPYVISKVPNSSDIIMIIISGYVIGQQIVDLVQKISELAADLSGNPFSIAATIIKIIIFVAFLAILIISIIKLIQDLFNAIISPIKYHACMRLQTLLEKGAAQLGQKFESSVFDDPFWKDVVVMPEKYDAPVDSKDDTLFGFTSPSPDQNGYFRGTFGDLMNEVKKLWNGRKIVGDGVIKIEPRDVNTSQPDYQLGEVEILSYKTNAEQLKALYEFRFATDLSDTNTINELTGTISEVVTSPIAINNPDMVLMKGREKISSVFALGKRKEDLTSVENLFKALLTFASATVGTVANLASKLRVGKKKKKSSASPPPTFSTGQKQGGVSGESDIGRAIEDMRRQIEGRIGMLKLSSDQTQAPKIMALDGVKLKPQATDRLKSNLIIEDFHQSNMFTPSDEYPNANQWKRYVTPSPVTFCLEDFRKIENNNLIFDNEGKEAKLESFDWNPETAQATVSFRRNELYSNNLKQTIVTPNGL